MVCMTKELKVERLDNMVIWFQEQPERIMNLGTSCFAFGCLLLAAGLWARVANAAVNAMHHLAKLPLEASLATSYPNLPTWWIPENMFGFLIALLLIGYGGMLLLYGKKLKRLLNY